MMPRETKRPNSFCRLSRFQIPFLLRSCRRSLSSSDAPPAAALGVAPGRHGGLLPLAGHDVHRPATEERAADRPAPPYHRRQQRRIARRSARASIGRCAPLCRARWRSRSTEGGAAVCSAVMGRLPSGCDNDDSSNGGRAGRIHVEQELLAPKPPRRRHTGAGPHPKVQSSAPTCPAWSPLPTMPRPRRCALSAGNARSSIACHRLERHGRCSSELQSFCILSHDVFIVTQV